MIFKFSSLILRKFYIKIFYYIKTDRGESHRGVVVIVQDYNIEVIEFELWSLYYVHFWNYTLRKRTPLRPSQLWVKYGFSTRTDLV